MASRVLTLEKRISRLESAIAELQGDSWQRVKPAAQKLDIAPGTLIYRLKAHPDVYREGKCWKWNRSKTHRLINLSEWRKVSLK